MPTSSARPERLHRFASEVDERAARAGRDADDVSDALRRYQIACTDAPQPGRPDVTARMLLDRLRAFADAVDRVADAFIAADRAGPRPLDRVDDLVLSRRLVRDHPGIVDTALLVPIQHQEGRREGARLAALGPDQAVVVLARATTTPMTGPYASGILDGLGPQGVLHVVEALGDGYRGGEIGYHDLDAAIGGLVEVLRVAGRALPIVGAAPVPQQDGPAPDLSDPYALDLSIIRRLGSSSRGQQALRQLALDAAGLHPALVAALAGAILDPVHEPGDAWTLAPRALVDRSRDRRLPDAFDLPVLRLLRDDPRAAGLWELGSPADRSRLAANLTRRTPPEQDVVADLVRILYVDPITIGGGKPWAAPAPEAAPGRGQARTERALAGILDAVQGLDRPTRALATVLADLARVHVGFFGDVIADRAWASLEPDPRVVSYFEAVARDPTALRRSVGGIIEHGGREAAACLATIGPSTPRPDHLRSCLQPVRDLGLSLERGALRAGRNVDARAAFAVSLAAYAANLAVAAGAKATGPYAPVAGYLGKGLVSEGKRAAIERHVESNDRLDRGPARAMDRSLPYLAAVALTADDRWGPLVARPRALVDLDVVGSAADWASFRRWIRAQPPQVRDQLRQLVSAGS